MRWFIRQFIIALLCLFVFRLAVQAQTEQHNSLPKAVLLTRVAPEEPIPSKEIDPQPIVKAMFAH